MEATIRELLDLFVRWTHVIAGIMWIGNSLLFNWLDRNLRPIEPPPEGSLGKIWLLHSGAFYEVEKKLLPAGTPYPDKVHWFMFQNLTTWVSGICLLIIVYYMGGAAYMIDPSVADDQRRRGDRDRRGRADRRLAGLRSAVEIAARQEHAAGLRDLVRAADRRQLRPGAGAERAGGLHPCRRAAGHADDRECLVLCGALAARAGGGQPGRAAARPGALVPRQAALDPQQLHDLPGDLHHDQQSLSQHLRQQLELADPGGADGRQRGLSPLPKHSLHLRRLAAPGRRHHAADHRGA